MCCHRLVGRLESKTALVVVMLAGVLVVSKQGKQEREYTDSRVYPSKVGKCQGGPNVDSCRVTMARSGGSQRRSESGVVFFSFSCFVAD
jgi:hypothetical protein